MTYTPQCLQLVSTLTKILTSKSNLYVAPHLTIINEHFPLSIKVRMSNKATGQIHCHKNMKACYMIVHVPINIGKVFVVNYVHVGFICMFWCGNCTIMILIQFRCSWLHCLNYLCIPMHVLIHGNTLKVLVAMFLQSYKQISIASEYSNSSHNMITLTTGGGRRRRIKLGALSNVGIVNVDWGGNIIRLKWWLQIEVSLQIKAPL